MPHSVMDDITGAAWRSIKNAMTIIAIAGTTITHKNVGTRDHVFARYT